MKIEQKRERLLKAIKKNIETLFAGSEMLATQSFFGPAVHLIMAAKEECAKWMLLYCWDHLDEATKSKVYNHNLKHAAVGLFYFLSGKLHAAEFGSRAFHMLAERNPEIAGSSRRLAEWIENLVLTIDPEEMSQHLNQVLHGDGSRSPKDNEYVQKGEADRLNSVYVDFNKDFELIANPTKYHLNDYERNRKDVVLARFHIDQLSGLKPNKEVINETFPEWKAELAMKLGELKNTLAKETRNIVDDQN